MTTDNEPQIVDIHGLAEVLSCSVSTLNKNWREYHHFFIGSGETAKGARFDVEDVVNHLKDRDYSESMRQWQKEGRTRQSYRATRKVKNKCGGESGLVFLPGERPVKSVVLK